MFHNFRCIQRSELMEPMIAYTLLACIYFLIVYLNPVQPFENFGDVTLHSRPLSCMRWKVEILHQQLQNQLFIFFIHR